MPIYAGFHPYFKTEKDTFYFGTEASTYLDVESNQTREFSGEVQKVEMENSLILQNTDENSITMSLQDSSQIIIESGSEFRYTVLWTEPGKEFVCVEPWMAMPNELNNKNELVMIEPKDELKMFMRITVQEK